MAPAFTSCCLFSSEKVFYQPHVKQKVGIKHTRMSHVKQCSCRIALYSHVLRPCEASERDQRPRLCDLGLIIVCIIVSPHPRVTNELPTMGRKVGDTAYCITLNFNIRTKHLANEGFETTKLDDEELVVR